MTNEQTKKYLKREKIFIDINRERTRQDELHAPKSNNYERFTVLMEECCELSREVQDNNIALLKSELIQVAAYAIRFIEELEGDET